MNIEIYYCQMWNYLPQASRLEEELKGNFSNINVILIASSGGNFKIFLDGLLIFDKLAISETEAIFPKENEITNKIKNIKS